MRTCRKSLGGSSVGPAEISTESEEVKNNMLSYLVSMQSRLMGVLRDEEGQGLAEYSLILVFIAVIAIGALTFLGNDITSILSEVGEKL